MATFLSLDICGCKSDLFPSFEKMYFFWWYFGMPFVDSVIKSKRQKNNPTISFIILVSPKFLWVFQTGFLLPIVRTKYISFYLQVAVIFLFFLLFKKQYFVLKIVLTYCVKKCSCDGEKLLRIQGWRPRICKIHSNSEMSDQLLTQNIFSTYSWRLLHSNNYDANLNK